jgi:hypothetical protein
LQREHVLNVMFSEAVQLAHSLEVASFKTFWGIAMFENVDLATRNTEKPVAEKSEQERLRARHFLLSQACCSPTRSFHLTSEGLLTAVQRLDFDPFPSETNWSTA